MNDEIKEILDWLKDEDIYLEDYGYQYKRISLKETTQLLDYITNLQQDNEMYAQLKDEYEEEIKDLQQENEKLNNLFEYNMQTLINIDKLYEKLTNNWNELEELLKIKKARMLNEPDYSKYYLEGYETAIQSTHSSHSGIMLATAKNSIVVLCDELLDKMKEIKENK